MIILIPQEDAFSKDLLLALRLIQTYKIPVLKLSL
jgi:hypothetical protein